MKYIVLALLLVGCTGNVATPLGKTMGYTSEQPIINIKNGDKEAHFQGDTILLEKDMMMEVMTRMGL